MGHTLNHQKSLLSRVWRIKGQAVSIETTLESGQECLKILHQVTAVSGAVNGLMSELLEGHIREHLMEKKAFDQERKEDFDEIVAVIRSYMN